MRSSSRLSARVAGVLGGWVPLALAVVLVPAVAGAYHGALSSADSGILGTGNWIITGPTSLEWWATQNPNGTWHYKYVLSHPAGGTSHFIIEASDNFASDDIISAIGDFGDIVVGELAPPSGNPGMPEALFGIKFDDTWGNTTSIEFDCTRQPVWGDFYAKDGNAGGLGVNAAWNAGFTVNDYDPSDPAQDGSVQAHVLVPDTTGGLAPVRAMTWSSVKAMYR